jgi:osmotically-inducible protein OsmY
MSLPFFRLATMLGALAILAGCDRPFAPSANAADTLPRAQDGADAARTAARPRSSPASPPPPAAISDAAITARVNSALHNDPALAGSDLSVNTDHGVVSLTGTVKSPEQVAEASARAQEPDGVMRIDSHLSVNPP